MLTKVRDKEERPRWMGEDAYKGLLKHWESDGFKKMYSQNKNNRSSSKGGAVHSTGRKAHHDIALDMRKILGQVVYPDELFWLPIRRSQAIGLIVVLKKLMITIRSVLLN